MAGYKTYLRFENLKDDLKKLGLEIGQSGHRWQEDVIALCPLSGVDSLPIYSRDANIYTGTLDEVESWVKGVLWARAYDQALRLSNQKKREAKEDLVRQDNLARKLKGPNPADPSFGT